jgi:hypothetical protein
MLAFDATTQGGIHINEVHVTFKDIPALIVDIDQLPGGTALDYADHMLSRCGQSLWVV